MGNEGREDFEREVFSGILHVICRLRKMRTENDYSS